MRDYVDATWGWDDDEQLAFFDEHFDPTRCQMLQVEDADIGVLAVEERFDEIYPAAIQLLPEWQSRGIGSAVVGSLVERGAVEAKPVTLLVLRTTRALPLSTLASGFSCFGRSRLTSTCDASRTPPRRPSAPKFERHS